MNEKNLEAISPIDGRYFDKTEKLKKYFSEKALIYYSCLLYTSPSPRDVEESRMPSSA